MRILKKSRESDPSYYHLCHLVRQGEQPREGFLLLSNLVEDQMGGANGYVDWILQIHRQVQQNPQYTEFSNFCNIQVMNSSVNFGSTWDIASECFQLGTMVCQIIQVVFQDYNYKQLIENISV